MRGGEVDSTEVSTVSVPSTDVARDRVGLTDDSEGEGIEGGGGVRSVAGGIGEGSRGGVGAKGVGSRCTGAGDGTGMFSSTAGFGARVGRGLKPVREAGFGGSGKLESIQSPASGRGRERRYSAVLTVYRSLHLIRSGKKG